MKFLWMLLPLTLTGCASTITALLNRPIQADNYYFDGNHAVSVMSLQGQYRVGTLRDIKSTLRVCAESLPDTATAAAAASSLSVSDPVTGGVRAVSGSDEFSSALLQTFQRTETADVVRQLGWQYCQAWSNGALTDSQYAELLVALTRGAITVLEKRASAPPASISNSVIVQPRTSAPPAAR